SSYLFPLRRLLVGTGVPLAHWCGPVTQDHVPVPTQVACQVPRTPTRGRIIAMRGAKLLAQGGLPAVTRSTACAGRHEGQEVTFCVTYCPDHRPPGHFPIPSPPALAPRSRDACLSPD